LELKLYPLTVRHISIFKKLFFLALFTGIYGFAYGQVGAPADSVKSDTLSAKKLKEKSISYDVNKQFDFNDLTRDIFHPHKKADTLHKGSGITIVPNIAANPTIGAQLGIKAVAGKKLGGDPNTFLSVAATSASITTRHHLLLYQPQYFHPRQQMEYTG
jgi:hypothetical protein